MTPMEIVAYYVELLIMQYRGQPKARATIEAQTIPVIMPQGLDIVYDDDGNIVYDDDGGIVYASEGDDDLILPLAVQAAFAIDTAVGVQLDAIGKYLAVKRDGFDFSGAVTLTEDQFRQLIRVMVVRSSMRADLKSIQAFVAEFFPDSLQMFDNLYMHNSWFYKVAVGTDIVAEFFVKQGFLPRPLAVSAPIVGSFPNGNFFGFRTYLAAAPPYVSPLNTYTVYEEDWPWLGYNNVILI